MQMNHDPAKNVDVETEKQLLSLSKEFDEFMNDDFNTAKVLANMFTLASLINSFKSGALEKLTLSAGAIETLQQRMKQYLEDIFGLQGERAGDNDKLDGVLKLIIDIRKEARSKKDFMTSDKIRNSLQEMGIVLKDEKDGSVSWSLS
jgi:cysteinyl-tRNA synthetase